MFRIRDVYPPDPNFFSSQKIRIRIKEFKYFYITQKLVTQALENMIRDVHLGSRILIFPLPDPGVKKADLDPQHWLK